jgi:hypothetical protein
LCAPFAASIEPSSWSSTPCHERSHVAWPCNTRPLMDAISTSRNDHQWFYWYKGSISGLVLCDALFSATIQIFLSRIGGVRDGSGRCLYHIFFQVVLRLYRLYLVHSCLAPGADAEALYAPAPAPTELRMLFNRYGRMHRDSQKTVERTQRASWSLLLIIMTQT